MVTAVSMTLVGVFISFSDNLIRPLVIKGRDNMHPFLALIAIFGGVKLFGFFGVFVGPIVAAMLVALLELWPHIGGQLGIQFYNRKRTRKP
ncbi:MAG: AI-2E family transporter [Oligoflexia bacterium]|nr:AI-2E family transporter [Oligoflexia bacterium]